MSLSVSFTIRFGSAILNQLVPGGFVCVMVFSPLLNCDDESDVWQRDLVDSRQNRMGEDYRSTDEKEAVDTLTATAQEMSRVGIGR